MPTDRRHVILERVADEQTIHVGDLARELGVSEMTIRRDIRLLERDGFLRQTYGGATAHLTRSLDVAFNARALQHPREKRLIAMRAAPMVDGLISVFLGVGTTVEQVARYLPARELGVSEMTIRRDIRLLERDGFLRQTYGGATAHLTRSLDVAFNARALQHPREKRLIAMRAAPMVDGLISVFLGVGTTVEQVARYLPARESLTVVTPSLPIASLLGTRPVGVVTLGGTVRRDDLTAVGPVAVATLARYRFEAAIIGAAGISARWGITELADEEAEIQRVAISRAERVIVVADGSKVGAATAAVVAAAAAAQVLVTDTSAPAAGLDALRALGVQVVIASPGEPGEPNPAAHATRPTTPAPRS